MNEQEIRNKIAEEILNFQFMQPPAGNDIFQMMYNAQKQAQRTLADLAKGNR